MSEAYNLLTRRLLRSYLASSTVAVLGVGSLFIFATLHIQARAVLWITAILFVSFLTMVSAELLVYRYHMAPIRRALSESCTEKELRKAYLRTHQLPQLTVLRIMGPHLFGVSVPALSLSAWAIARGDLNLSPSDLLSAAVGAVLVATMHALIEYYLTTTAVSPMLETLIETGEKRGISLSLEGRILVSLRMKLIISLVLLGIFPLILFTLANAIRLAQQNSALTVGYWQWALLILPVSIAISILGAILLWRNIFMPMELLQKSLREIEQGRMDKAVPDPFSDEFSRLIAGMNHMRKGLLERDRVNASLVESYFATLATALDARDPYTAGHSLRVAHYACTIAELSGESAVVIDRVKRSALLHDIGKIGVRDDVLLKPDRLTEDEFEQIKKHPELGEAILKQVQPEEAMAPLLPGVRSHHEQYDGRGYPDGLAGEHIPKLGRIIAVADAFDAMTSDRPYRVGMDKEKALRIMREGAGVQWDPFYTEVFLEWAEARWTREMLLDLTAVTKLQS
ncbi:HD domain-containing phosphohydrolase [Ferroacidibacillus organovorans]|uniref:Phosphohydrolase n=1 Tax=Ferroacidibacillus organovorans TaxID=1765683 RepID=A0A161QFE6_9BACL|nr:HD domain-containing phosphohydrolase [Ferroacidibacillus organovorans]KYP80670.1 hypothetical protein AYJ22_10465 [Ferroacidibacillus organovorans]OAG93516.1 hypothetical protein AYW79_10265 [Ferroacidibacillus organovorans]OPG17341.1 hypothetical protein B2M26_02630 [Ferroacidibacillus organovorans]